MVKGQSKRKKKILYQYKRHVQISILLAGGILAIVGLVVSFTQIQTRVLTYKTKYSTSCMTIPQCKAKEGTVCSEGNCPCLNGVKTFWGSRSGYQLYQCTIKIVTKPTPTPCQCQCAYGGSKICVKGNLKCKDNKGHYYPLRCGVGSTSR